MSARLVRFVRALAILVTILAALPAAILGSTAAARAEGAGPDLSREPAGVPGVQSVR